MTRASSNARRPNEIGTALCSVDYCRDEPSIANAESGNHDHSLSNLARKLALCPLLYSRLLYDTLVYESLPLQLLFG